MSSSKTMVFWGDFKPVSARNTISVCAMNKPQFRFYGIQFAMLANSMDALLGDLTVTFHLPRSEQHNKNLQLQVHSNWKYDWTNSTGPYELIQTMPSDKSCYYFYFTGKKGPIYDTKLNGDAWVALLKNANLFWCYYSVPQKVDDYVGTPLNMRSQQYIYNLCTILCL